MTTNNEPTVIQIPDAFTRNWNSTLPYSIWYGGRGSAKSWTKAIYFLCRASQKEYFRCIFARDTQKNVRGSQYQLFKDIVARFPCFENQFSFHETTMKITHKASGNFLSGGSFEQPDTLRSVADPTDFWAEEPITREYAIKRSDFFDITGSLRNPYGIAPRFHFTFNPISKQTWIYQDFFQDGLYDGEVEILFVNYWDNPFCPESTIKFLESLQRLDPKRYEVDALGNWGIAYEGLIYKEYEAVDGDKMPESTFYGLDFGYNDPCALVEGCVVDTPNQDKKDLFFRELLYEVGHTSATLIARFQDLGVNKSRTMICDNARPEMIEDLKRAGYNAKPCTKYKGSVADGINRIKKFKLNIVKGSRNMFDEISTYCWKAKDGVIMEEPDGGMDHLLDAARYGTEIFVRKESGMLEFDHWV